MLAFVLQAYYNQPTILTVSTYLFSVRVNYVCKSVLQTNTCTKLSKTWQILNTMHANKDNTNRMTPVFSTHASAICVIDL